MAADAELSGKTAVVENPVVQPLTLQNGEPETKNADFNYNSSVMLESSDSGSKNSDSDSNNSSLKPDIQMNDFVDMLKKLKLNPLAKEFFPSWCKRDQLGNHFMPANKDWSNDGFPSNRRKRNNYTQGTKRVNGRSVRAQREDNIRRTVYVSDIDQNITEEQLAALFSAYGHVVDCRICGDPNSRLRFAFVEFADMYSARASFYLTGTMLGFSPIKVLPSKTAILPVNPTFLPRSEDEREMCARTVYCTNINKKVSQADVKNFFETRCGKVSRLRLLGDHVHSTHIAFVEFAILVKTIPKWSLQTGYKYQNRIKVDCDMQAESAIAALDCCGEPLGSQQIRVSPSKTPVRQGMGRPVLH